MSVEDPIVVVAPRASGGSSDGLDGPHEHRDRHRRRGPVAWLLSMLIELYRSTAPFRQPRCRFHPSCSSYALEAVTTHGAFSGSWLAARRLLRCHPWNPGGVDHVPPRSPR